MELIRSKYNDTDKHNRHKEYFNFHYIQLRLVVMREMTSNTITFYDEELTRSDISYDAQFDYTPTYTSISEHSKHTK